MYHDFYPAHTGRNESVKSKGSRLWILTSLPQERYVPVPSFQQDLPKHIPWDMPDGLATDSCVTQSLVFRSGPQDHGAPLISGQDLARWRNIDSRNHGIVLDLLALFVQDICGDIGDAAE